LVKLGKLKISPVKNVFYQLGNLTWIHISLGNKRLIYVKWFGPEIFADKNWLIKIFVILDFKFFNFMVIFKPWGQGHNPFFFIYKMEPHILR